MAVDSSTGTRSPLSSPAHRDDDNDLVELATSADILECLDYFATDPSVSSSSSLARLPSCITVRLELVVEYDGPNLSETDAASSVWSAAPSARPGGPATRATSFGGEREAVLTRWRMQQQEATIDVDAASDDWIRRPAFSVVAAAAAGSQPPVDSASSSASASAIDADNEQDWDTRTVSSISFAPVRALPTNPSLRRPTNVTEDALYPNFAPPPRWLSSLGPAAQPPYPLPFSFSPYSAPEIPVLSPTHARGNDCTLPPVAPHHYAPLFAPTQGSFDIHFARPSVREVADSLDGFSLASPSQSLRERVQDLFAPSSDDESVRGGGDPLFGRQVPVRIASEALHGRNAESTWTATDSDTDSLPPSGHDQNGTIRAKETAAETRARLKALADLRGEYWCTECGKRIEGARYSCAVCEGFDLCRDCELGPPSRSSSRRHKPETIPLRHDLSHILLKIPISLSLPALGSALLSAHTLASSLAQPRSHPAPLPSSLSHSTASYLEKGDLDSYWSWWMRWYAQMPPGSHALWPTGMGTEEVSKHSWSAQGATSVGGGGGRREEHTYPPQPPAPSAPPAPPTPPPPPSHISSASAVVRPSTFSRFSSPHFTHFAAASHGQQGEE
ncbi:zinc finger, ZZ-type protein [Rhodotorula toruloides]|uniref:Zinc finger, ZZ-type protein n=1 Tax=Rhodotorula toruloides TaxID=5286 RepID=A0A511KFZ6_RHOTO|nr:zinc finger, ZZ-type protein [Rhodotorula toruloides]